MKNWKTTLSGVATIGAGITLIVLGHSLEGMALLPVGMGLITAKDNNVTGK